MAAEDRKTGSGCVCLDHTEWEKAHNPPPETCPVAWALACAAYGMAKYWFPACRTPSPEPKVVVLGIKKDKNSKESQPSDPLGAIP